jgi:hypothetical protein
MKTKYSQVVIQTATLSKMFRRKHQITVRLLTEDKKRLEKLSRLTGCNLSDLQIKFIDYLLNNKEKYIAQYIHGEYDPQLLTLDEGLSVSVRLSSHTFQVFRQLVKHMSTNNGALLRYIYQEKFRDVGFVLGEKYNDCHIDDVDENEFFNFD